MGDRCDLRPDCASYEVYLWWVAIMLDHRCCSAITPTCSQHLVSSGRGVVASGVSVAVLRAAWRYHGHALATPVLLLFFLLFFFILLGFLLLLFSLLLHGCATYQVPGTHRHQLLLYQVPRTRYLMCCVYALPSCCYDTYARVLCIRALTGMVL